MRRVVERGTTSILATMIFPQWRRDVPFGFLCDGGCAACGACLDVDADVPRIAETLRKRVGVVVENCAVLEGIHAEGPAVADAGGLPPREEGTSPETLSNLLDLLGPAVRVVTVSPSVDAPDYPRIRELLRRGIRPALGHDRHATAEQILGALRLSPEPLHITHAFNVQAFHHRTPSLANFALTHEFPSLPEYEGCVPPTVEVRARRRRMGSRDDDVDRTWTAADQVAAAASPPPVPRNIHVAATASPRLVPKEYPPRSSATERTSTRSSSRRSRGRGRTGSAL